MNVEKPIQVGVSEKATNNPPIEILVQNEATLAGLPKTWPEGTVAHTPGNVNRWKWQSGAWVAISDVDSLSELSDVNITNPTNGQAIIYDGTAQKWVNGSAGGGGGGGLVVEVTQSGDRYTMGKTAREIMAAFSEGTSVVCHFPDATWYADQYSPVVAVYGNIDYDTQQVSTCDVYVWFLGNIEFFSSTTIDDYPTLSFG